MSQKRGAPVPPFKLHDGTMQTIDILGVYLTPNCKLFVMSTSFNARQKMNYGTQTSFDATNKINMTYPTLLRYAHLVKVLLVRHRGIPCWATCVMKKISRQLALLLVQRALLLRNLGAAPTPDLQRSLRLEACIVAS